MDFTIRQISLDDQGRPGATKQAAPALETIADLNLSYGPLIAVEDAGITLARGLVAPGAEVPPHAADTRYILLVISGVGNLTLMVDGRDEPDLVVPYQPGALFDFPPHARHGWINSGSEPLEWFGIEITA